MKICYVSYKLDNPRDQITLRGLEEIGVETRVIQASTPGWRKYFNLANQYRNYKGECSLVMIGYASSVLVIFMKIISRKKVVYNSLATFYDSMIVSRFAGSFLNPKSWWYYMIDFIAFRAADRIFLECQAQKDLVVRVFRINPEKISVHFVGSREDQFYFDPAITKKPIFTVVFRGMFLPEAGADVVVKAAKELEGENINVRIIGRGLLKKDIERLVSELAPDNLELITEVLPITELREKMLECHISLGQLADHRRVYTTVPHKVFESMSMKLAYLTGDNKGVMEFLTDGETCFTVPPGDYHALARKIIELRDHPQDLEQVAENAYQLYQREFTSKILAEKIIQEIAQI